MITLRIPERHFPKIEGFNNATQEFVIFREEKHISAYELKLEYSLKSIAKWEMRWHKPFFNDEKLSSEEWIDLIRCMTVNTVKDPESYNYLTNKEVNVIQAYMEDPQSAWEIVPDKDKDKEKKKAKKAKRKMTVEAIYYKMIQYGVWESCENWNLNRLLALLDYFDAQGGSTPGAGGQKKKTERELMSMYHDMNQKARAKYHSRG